MKRFTFLVLFLISSSFLACNAARCPETETIVKVVLLKDINFAFDRADLLPSAVTLLEENLELLQKDPNLLVRIEGHCDYLGSDAYNQNLSERRAASVRNYFVGQGLDFSRFAIFGYGRTRPIAPNDTDEGRAKNRRVELKIVRPGEVLHWPFTRLPQNNSGN
ncbi:MAG: hypothetical protein COX62_02750 [Deltaproteobacteria bacterium CG_4_10_14_0_2_um_filter_43_8]|nr:MAG: hypothetical protein COV43_02120 [Deltaproteobacteria bacterium CG11_big_fil_rev_8_21_14_0_20_42_23]PJA21333.1 MAG: hypothetical protein COX62_02750 [Deltaproteobacteria bacterium CG_4_10_14_0_2_um_filter_43_8]PJC64726.1 MAG: hypothetical protein CO021_02655 [Deltaproteobacteria bacterium CG_4_9_14_0_2_um_filter_42_21]